MRDFKKLQSLIDKTDTITLEESMDFLDSSSSFNEFVKRRNLNSERVSSYSTIFFTEPSNYVILKLLGSIRFPLTLENAVCYLEYLIFKDSSLKKYNDFIISKLIHLKSEAFKPLALKKFRELNLFNKGFAFEDIFQSFKVSIFESIIEFDIEKCSSIDAFMYKKIMWRFFTEINESKKANDVLSLDAKTSLDDSITFLDTLLDTKSSPLDSLVQCENNLRLNLIFKNLSFDEKLVFSFLKNNLGLISCPNREFLKMYPHISYNRLRVIKRSLKTKLLPIKDTFL